MTTAPLVSLSEPIVHNSDSVGRPEMERVQQSGVDYQVSASITYYGSPIGLIGHRLSWLSCIRP